MAGNRACDGRTDVTGVLHMLSHPSEYFADPPSPASVLATKLCPLTGSSCRR
jgi:hypothetical protein